MNITSLPLDIKTKIKNKDGVLVERFAIGLLITVVIATVIFLVFV